MFILVQLLLIPCSLFGSKFESALWPYATASHKICSDLISESLRHRELLNSLICGAPLPDSEVKQALKSSHLIHLIIISAGHFLWLEKALAILRINYVIRTLLFIFYGFVTLLQPPAIRFLFHRGTDLTASLFNLHLKAHHKILIASLFCLLFFPAWVDSMSFLLSWGCSLSLYLSGQLTDNKASLLKKILYRHFYFLLFLSPWMITFGNWHPLQIISQILLAPIILGVLFPIGLLSLLITKLEPIFDQLFDWLLIILKNFQNFQPDQIDRPPSLSLWFWTYLLLLHVALHFFEVTKKRSLK
jgi:ComEC/Rec2-related protein